MEADSTTLLERLAGDGGRSAWEAQSLRHARMALAIAGAILGPAGRDDAWQEICLHWRAQARRFVPTPGDDREDQARRWLRRLAINVCLGLRRRLRRRMPAPEPADQPAPDEPLERSERAAAVRAALDRLGDDDRRIVVLHAWCGLGGDRLAGERGCAPGTARMRLHRALRRLRRHLPEVLSLALAGAGSACAAAPLPAVTAAPTLPARVAIGGASMSTILATAAATVSVLLVVGGLAAASGASGTATARPASAATAAVPPDQPPGAGRLVVEALGGWELRIVAEQRTVAEVFAAVAAATDLTFAVDPEAGTRRIDFRSDRIHQQRAVFDLAERAGLDVGWPIEGGAIRLAPRR